jgi:NADPH:quinone reductase-like Zn-dependent oxidoreductase
VKAATITGYGGVDQITVGDVPDPAAGPGEIIVSVRAASLNRLDVWTLRGSLGLDLHWPHVLGADAAGEIAEVGEGVTGLRTGMRVMVNPGVSCRMCERCRAGEHSECIDFRILGEHLPGTFAEKVKVPQHNVFPIPDHLSWAEGASLGITFTTAYRMLFTRAGMRPGEWLLVTGIGGGLALALLQLARPVAGRVFVSSSSPAKLARAEDLGADEGIDYLNEDVGRAVRGFTGKRGVDLVADSAGGSSLDSLVRALRPGGRVVVAGATSQAKAEIDLRRVFWSQVSVVGSTMGSDADVSDMLRAVSGARLRPIVDQVIPLDEARDAFSRLEATDRFGKVVLEMG